MLQYIPEGVVVIKGDQIQLFNNQILKMLNIAHEGLSEAEIHKKVTFSL
jgi:hypothetical protein